MRFTLATALLATTVLAAPRPQTADEPEANPPREVVVLTGLTTTVAADGLLETMSFSLGTDEGEVGCANEEGLRPSLVSLCGATKYRFGVLGGVYTETAVNVTVYHEMGPAWGYWGTAAVPISCNTDTGICEQPAESSVDVELRF